MPPRLPRFTAQQREILRLIAESYTTDEIAASLGVKRATAKTLVSRVVQLVGLRGRHERAEAADLTRREAEVAHLLRLGLSDREIADVLGIGLRTAEHHTRVVLRKTGVASRDGLRETRN